MVRHLPITGGGMRKSTAFKPETAGSHSFYTREIELGGGVGSSALWLRQLGCNIRAGTSTKAALLEFGGRRRPANKAATTAMSMTAPSERSFKRLVRFAVDVAFRRASFTRRTR